MTERANSTISIVIYPAIYDRHSKNSDTAIFFFCFGMTRQLMMQYKFKTLLYYKMRDSKTIFGRWIRNSTTQKNVICLLDWHCRWDPCRNKIRWLVHPPSGSLPSFDPGMRSRRNSGLVQHPRTDSASALAPGYGWRTDVQTEHHHSSKTHQIPRSQKKYKFNKCYLWKFCKTI